MRILLANDDGILAPGLAALYAAVRDLGEVVVVAPASPQSAKAHSITLASPLTVQRVHVGGETGFEGLSVAGSPADCVRLAIRNLLDGRPDLVLSGINAGANVGINVFYSGTVAAAAEAAMMGIPAVAFSVETHPTETDHASVARQCRAVLDELLDGGMPAGELVNVNIPAAREGVPKGLRVCPQSDAGVDDAYVPIETNPPSESAAAEVRHYRLAEEYEFTDPHHASDVGLLRAGFVTVTPLRVDMTDHAKLDAFRTKLNRDQHGDAHASA